MFLGASRLLFERWRWLRKNETSAEQLLWSRLSNKQLGVKFRRQHPLHRYIADFYCHSHRLVIEVDGPSMMLLKTGLMTTKGPLHYWISTFASFVSRMVKCIKMLTW